MSYCLNPTCQKPQNPSAHKFCQTCGTKLLLKDRYRAIKLIGQGGFGRTFLAIDEDKPSKPSCVIKQFYPQAQGTNTVQKAAELFEQEAVRLDDLGKHHQIPELLAHCSQDGQQYLVQEFIDGQNLAQELDREGVFDESKIWRLLNDALPLLEFIHSHQVIHRDIKPENIIRRPDGQLVLVDFGAAKFASRTTLSVTGTVIGSAGYTAPEQARGKATFASDLYGLGVTCIHLLTQLDPFDLFSDSEDAWVWRDYLQNNPVSSKLGQIIDKMLERGTSRRYKSAPEILEAFNPQQRRLNPTPSTKNWQCVRTLTGHTGAVNSVAISADGETIASGGNDNMIKVWRLEDGKQLHSFPFSDRSGAWVNTVAISPEKILVAGGGPFSRWGRYKTIKLWHLSSGKEIRTLDVRPEVKTVAISPDGQTIASGSANMRDGKKGGYIFIHDMRAGKIVHQLSLIGISTQGFLAIVHAGGVNSVAISPDGQTLASCGADRALKLWKIVNGKLLYAIQDHSDPVTSLAFSPDGKIIVSGSHDKTVRLWNAGTGQCIIIYSHSGLINSVTISPDGKTIASGNTNNTIQLYNLSDSELRATLRGHSGPVTSVIFSPDGETIISGSQDNTVKIWRCE
ncbi:MAG: protein kinase [Hormoscilla sp.]